MQENPLLHVLGRHGAMAVIEALRGGGSWSVRSLAHEAQRPVASVARIVSDLEALRVVDTLRPGRDKQIQWRGGPAAAWLLDLQPPDLRVGAATTFLDAYNGPGTAHRWQAPGDDPARPSTKTRIVVLTDQEDDALDDVGPALDAVEAAGWPAPEVTVQDPAGLGEDEVAVAMRQPIASTM